MNLMRINNFLPQWIFILQLAFCLPLAAQDEGGSVIAGGDTFLGGSLSIWGNSRENIGGIYNYRNFHAETNVSFGGFVTNRIAIGVDFGYLFHEYERRGGGAGNKEKNNETRVGLYLRYYIPIGNSGRFYFFGQADLSTNYQRHQVDLGNAPSESRWLGEEIYLRPGISYLVSNKIALQSTYGTAGYSFQKELDGSNTTHSEFGVLFTPSSLHFGILWFFR